VTTAIGRPDYDKVVPTVAVDAGGNEVTQGNPGLEPLKAVNVDASLEYYLRGGGLVAGAVFYKDIDNPIFISTQTVPGTGIYGGVTLTNAIVTQPRNGDRSKLTGFEFNVVQPFTFLPAPWDGFGMSLNVTLVTGDTRVPGRADKLPLVQQSKRLANLQAYYEKYGFAARVVYNYRSPVLEIVGADA
jgi:TonB-dependent receptor